MINRLEKMGEERVLVIGFAALILIGAVFLCLPISSADGSMTNFLDCLFTSTTSVCVTGLVVVPTYEHWSVFGKFVIMVLIQLGGLGVVACTTFIFMALRKKITLQSRKLIQDCYNLDTMSGVVALVRRVIKCTIIAELIGALFYSIRFIPQYGFIKGIAYSVFHAVSAFCNAGIDILGPNSLVPYVKDPLINGTTMGLIIMGGLGFVVWWDIWDNLKKAYLKKIPRRQFFKRLGLHSKVVLATTAILIFGGTALILLFDWNYADSLQPLGILEKIQAALFQSVTTRTAGFETIPQASFSDSSSFISMMLMFIGGSPMGTAGGIKTTTMAVLFLIVRGYVKGKTDTEVFRRRITEQNMRTSLVLIMIGLGVVCVAVLILTAVTPFDLMDCSFEVVSAFGTVGLTRGITMSLPVVGKIIIIFIMYMGRIGPLTLALAIARRNHNRSAQIKLPEQRIFIG